MTNRSLIVNLTNRFRFGGRLFSNRPLAWTVCCLDFRPFDDTLLRILAFNF